ncbi:MAG: YfiR family protein [Bacteroidia bacterium]|nr:YfiR family protein [Bacteroidia bacterium]
MKRTLLLPILFIFLSGGIFAQTTNYQVYGLFLMNIAKYSSWPAKDGNFQIVVYGKSKVLDELQKHEGKLVNGHPMKVVTVESPDQIGDAHLVFLADHKSSMLDDILKLTQGKSIMVVAEREGLYKKGAGFSFVIMENSTLRFDINNTELEKRQIKVSKNLTTLANAMM